MKTKVTRLPKSEVEIEGEIDADSFEGFFKKALEKLGASVEISGFRKGKAPENVLLSKIPEIKILEEMAQIALSEEYPKILEEEKIDAISRPEIFITKLARKNPLGFKIKTAVMPAIKLSDYKKIAKKLNEAEKGKKKEDVTEEEIESTITDIRKARAKKKHITEGATEEEAKEEELPKLNDEFVKALGPFENVADFREKLKENLQREKEIFAKEKNRLRIIEKVIEEATMEIPEILVEVELDKMLYKMESDIAQMGLRFEDYLKQINKTVEVIRKEFHEEGEKRAKLGLVLTEIAKLEKISPDPKQVEEEVAMILDKYKGADPERARVHTENVLTNEKIFQFLESL